MAAPQTNQLTWPPLEIKDCSQGFCSIYCPHWCYIVFPPPPPSFMDDDDDSTNPAFSPLVIAIIAILATAFILVSYYTIISKFFPASSCFRRRTQPDASVQTSSGNNEWHIPLSVGLDKDTINKITVWKYQKGTVGFSDCSVCLSEFREEESIRLLPKCNHAFHVQCIDMWLKSHSNCPLCRANIVLTGSSQPSVPAGNSEGVGNDEIVVTVSDILEVNMEENREDSSGGSSSGRSGGSRSSGLLSVSPISMKRSVSNGRIRHSVLPI